MKYDDASWHSGGDFPKDLPPEAAATHTGMFLAWALLSGLAGTVHIEEFPEELERLKLRQIAPARYLLDVCDGKFTDEDLSETGNSFASEYFDFAKGTYLRDYEETLGTNLPTLYHVADEWSNFDRLKPVLDQRFSTWNAKNR